MSGVIAVVPRAGGLPGDEVLAGMARGMSERGDLVRIHRTRGAVLVSCRHPWEPEQLFIAASSSGEGEVTVVADASLYYRADLARALAASGVSLPPAAGPAACVAAAHRAWGVEAPRHLEGDFAYVAWDERDRGLVCSRDFVGRRPLFYADLPDVVLIASSVGALLRYPGCPADLDPASIAAAAAGLFATGTATAYRAISVLPPGHTLFVTSGAVRMLRHWDPPRVEARPWVPGMSVAEGAEELRALLVEAVRERLDPAAPTAIWLSGGWDSTAVFGAGMAAAGAGTPADLRPVSISYPPGDPGREDDYISAVAQHWGAPVHWLSSESIPLLDRPEERAASRDEPFGHTYETWNRALARGSRAVGARVALDGVGGDHLFQLSFVNLADLLRRGRWLSLRREWHAKGLRGRRAFWQWAIIPLLPVAVRRVLGYTFGSEAVRLHLERPVPPWMDAGFLVRHRVLERESRNTPPRAGLSPPAYETYWYLTHPYGGRILSCVSALALQEGVEMRSPLLDRRIVEFACARPWTERSWGAETKRLLRAAVTGLVPDAVLAPRPYRTGLTSGYFAAGFRRTNAAWVQSVLDEPLLARIGMVDATVLRRAWELYLRYGDEGLGINLYFTLQAELWLRSRWKVAEGIPL